MVISRACTTNMIVRIYLSPFLLCNITARFTLLAWISSVLPIRLIQK